MIKGIGLDLCRISSMEKWAEKGAPVRLFSEEEQAYVGQKGVGKAQTLAGLFAAKEAYLKAQGVGIQSLNLNEISVSHDEMGRPFYHLTDGEIEKNRQKGILSAYLSITHEGDMAAALCILEG